MRIHAVSISTLLLIAAALLVAPKPAVAEIIYPWCAIYSERTVGATNCGFSTLAQCRATVSGIGGGCVQNPAYDPPVSRPRPKRHGQPR